MKHNIYGLILLNLLVIIPVGSHRLHTMEEFHRLFMELSLPPM